MWQLMKSELKYNWIEFAVLAVTFSSYSLFVLFDFQLITDKRFEIDYWGGFYSLLLIIFVYTVWLMRLKEKRIRYFALLPISNKELAFERFLLAAFPFIIVFVYLVVVHLIFVSTWHNETGSILGQTGIMFIIFAGFIRGRDDWFSHWNFGKRFQAAFISISLIQIILVIIFVTLPDLNKSLTPLFGIEFFHFAKIIFYLLGFVILITTVFSFVKRKSYLT